MSSYLEEAAALLRKAAQHANKYNIHAEQVELAKAFTTLAAIDKGLIPSEYADRIRTAYGEDD